MKNKFIKSILLVFVGLLSVGAFLPSYAFATDPCDKNLPVEIQEANGCSNNSDKNALATTITNIINAIVLSAGLVAVIFIVIGGFQYMTSIGDAAKVKKAKDTILYAAIGLIICVLAFAIVNFVIGMLK